MSFENLTIIITTLKSHKVLIPCLKSINNKIKILIIENSDDVNFKNEIEKDFKNVSCILTKENIGYAKSNNLGLSKVNTEYALVLNPDTVLRKDSINNFLKTASNYPDFTLIGPINNQEKEFSKDYGSKKLIKVKNLKGFAIFFNMKKFKNNFFDENFFLYFEEVDLCKRILKEEGNIFLDTNIIIDHIASMSVESKNILDLEKNRNWHWMWSTFYYHRKHYGFVLALMNIFPKLISAIIKYIFYLLIFKKESKEIYYSRLSGIINSLLGKKSWHRPTLD